MTHTHARASSEYTVTGRARLTLTCQVNDRARAYMCV